MKKWAIAFLGAAIVALGLSFWFSNARVQIQGPSALAVMDDGSVWLSVDHELWRLSPEGQLLERLSVAQLGIAGRVGALVRDPAGRLALGIRDVETLALFDPSTRRVTGSIRPQWPDSLARHGSRAIYFAFAADGRLAIATGGGHAVALFGPDGRYIARTAPGLYEFTNGLWWAGDTLWTTNTNAFTLVALTTPELAPRQQLRLPSGLGGSFLAMAQPSRGTPRDSGTEDAPLASLVRFGGDMRRGRIVDVFADGTEREFEGSAGMEVRDLAWQGRVLLAVDGAPFALRRFGADGKALAPFGDAAFVKALAELQHAKDRYRLAYLLALGSALVLFGAGFVLALVQQKRERRARGERILSAAECGMPPATWQTQLLSAGVFGAVVMLLLALLAVTALVSGSPLALAGVALLVAPWLTGRAVAWLARRPDMEPILNHAGLQRLPSPGLAATLEPQERVREVIMLMRSMNGQLLVLTTQRLLLFGANKLEVQLRQSLALDELGRVSLRRASKASAGWRVLAWISAAQAYLRVTDRAGQVFAEGLSHSPRTARRVAELLSMRRPRAGGVGADRVADPPPGPSSVRGPTAGTGAARGDWRPVLASLLLPGLGQWMQGRGRSALLFFIPAAVAAVGGVIPLVWTLAGPRAAVDPSMVLQVVGVQALVAVLSAWDSWNLRKP